MMMFNKRTGWAALAVFGMGSLIAAPAAAQNALGGGNALDANPGVGTGRLNAPAITPDFRGRNRVVTGDVPGGREFRGDVGYAAEGDFRDRLGTDDLFRFRADAAFSSPTVITGLGQQFRYAQDMATIEFRRFGAAAAPTLEPGRFQPWDIADDRVIRDRIRIDQLTRATAVGEALQRDREPRPVGMMVDRDGRRFVVDASGLRGLALSPLEERMHTDGLTTLDLIRLREDFAAGRATTFGTPMPMGFEGTFRDERRGVMPETPGEGMERMLPELPWAEPRRDGRPAEPQDGRVDAMRPDMMGDPRERDRRGLEPTNQMAQRAPMREQDVRHRQIIERIARRYADAEDTDVHVDPQVLRELDDRFARLRDRLRHREAEVVARADDRWALPDERDPWAEDPEQVDPELQAQREAEPLDPRDVEGIVPLLRHGQRVEELTGEQLTRFNELMALAEEAMRDGEYFTAERRYIRALRFHPGHPLATAGMAHAQLGAGLYIASSLTLQRLFMTNPEMIDVRYEAGLLPSRPRLLQNVEALRGRLTERRDRDSIAFLLAYVGHQLEEPEIVEQGMSVLRELRPDDEITRLVDRIWLHH